jgi:hypothetical protein
LNNDNNKENNKRQREWIKNNPEKAKAIWKRHRDKVKNDPKLRRQNYNMQAEYLQKIRRELFSILGGSTCTCKGINCWHEGNCIVNDIRVLNFDHKHPNKNLKLRKKGQYSEWLYYVKRSEQAKEELQVYCCNCNWVKMYNNKETRKPRD